MQEQKDKVIGLAGTVLFHALIIIFLLLIYLKAPINNDLTEWGGVPVMFGNVADAYGDDEPFGGGGNVVDGTISPNAVDVVLPQEETMTAPPLASGDNDAPVATQDLDETIAINEAANKEAEKKKAADLAEKQRQDRERKAAEDAKLAEQKRLADEQRIAQQKATAEAEKKDQINNQLAGLFGNGNGSGSRGETTGEGTQGVPTGNASYGKTSGIGGWGTFDLGGRSLGSAGLIKPQYTVDDYGTVVVDIVVNPQGAVVEASIGKGTNTTSAELKQEALRAARKTRFNIVTKSGNQKGNITYKFNLN